MSREHARQFIERVEKDEKFRSGALDASEAMLKFAREHDLNFTREELYREMQLRWGATREFWYSQDDMEFFCCLSKPPAF